MREREGFLQSVEQRFDRVAGWLAARRRGEGAGEHDLHARTERIREEVARARRAVGEAVHENIGRVRASLEGMKGDYGDAPPPHYALRGEEWDALRRHVHTTAHLMKDLSVADSPRWDAANEEYERSWAEVERAFEQEGDAASP